MTSASSSGTSPSNTDDACESPVAPLVVHLRDCTGQPVTADVEYRVSDGDWVNAVSCSEGECEIFSGSQMLITVRATLDNETVELSTYGAPCGATSAMLELQFACPAGSTGDLDSSTGGTDTGTSGSSGTSGSDSGTSDSGTSDSGTSDSGTSDSGTSDSGTSESDSGAFESSSGSTFGGSSSGSSSTG